MPSALTRRRRFAFNFSASASPRHRRRRIRFSRVPGSRPAPVVVAAAPPPRPEAPPLPFTYLGKLVEDGRTTLFLAREDRNYVVRAGDTIDGTYRIEEIRDAAAVFVYLPLKSKQTLAFAAGAPSDAGDTAPPERRGGRRKRPDDDDDDE